MPWEITDVMDQRKRFVLKDQRPDPPLAEVQVAEEERLLRLGQTTLFIA